MEVLSAGHELKEDGSCAGRRVKTTFPVDGLGSVWLGRNFVCRSSRWQGIILTRYYMAVGYCNSLVLRFAEMSHSDSHVTQIFFLPWCVVVGLEVMVGKL